MALTLVPTLALSLRVAAPAPLHPCAAASRTRLALMKIVEPDETWTTTASGLQFLDESPGAGETPESGAVVQVEYTGWLEANGKEFDSSIGRKPIAFKVGTGKVIPGWDEGISTMKVGGKRRLSIPAELAYGEKGAGDSIPANSRLQFECKLVGIESGFGAFAATFPGGLPNFIVRDRPSNSQPDLIPMCAAMLSCHEFGLSL